MCTQQWGATAGVWTGVLHLPSHSGISGEGLKGLASVSAETCGGKTSVAGSAGVIEWLCRPLISSVAKAAGVLCRAGHWNHGRFHCVAGTRHPCSSSLFLVISIHLSFMPLGEGVKLKWVLVQVPGRLGKLVAHLTLSQ